MATPRLRWRPNPRNLALRLLILLLLLLAINLVFRSEGLYRAHRFTVDTLGGLLREGRLEAPPEQQP